MDLNAMDFKNREHELGHAELHAEADTASQILKKLLKFLEDKKIINLDEFNEVIKDILEEHKFKKDLIAASY